MRIGSHIAVRIAGLALAGAGLLLVGRDAAVTVIDTSNELRNDAKELERLRRFEDTARFLLYTGDLVLSGESTYISTLAAEQAESVKGQLEELRASPLSQGSEEECVLISAHVDEVLRTIDEAAALNEEERDRRIATLNDDFYVASMALTDGIEQISGSLREMAEERRVAADSERTEMKLRSWASAIAFLVILLVGWRHMSFTIERPIRQLAGRAIEAREHGRFEDPERGPTEVRELGARLTELIEAQQRARQDLEEQVEVRTSELKEALAARAAFLANTSHELRTPMNAILGFAALMGDEDVSEDEKAEFISNIQESAQHLLELIEDVLDLSKIDAGHVGLRSLAVSPRAILKQVSSMLGPAALSKGLSFEARCAPTVPDSVRLDPIRFRQILVNLVNNAIKFTDQGSIEIEVSWVDDELLSRITDTGIGIEASKLEAIFESFEQADSSDTRAYGGTGLGLAICKKLSILMGGDVEVNSEVGKGSVFEVRLRAPASSIPAAKHRATLRPPSNADGAPAARERVLLVDDVATNRLLGRKVLQRAGLEVVEATTGKEALEAFQLSVDEGEPFAMILMDLQMPVMDGYQAVEAIRSFGYTGPIIALSGAVMKDQQERALDAGCSGFISKPIVPANLIETVQEIIGETSRRGS